MVLYRREKSQRKPRVLSFASRRCDSGWTLVEMLIVISLVMIMAGISTISYTSAITRSREAVLKEDLFRMRDAIDQYYADRNEYPASLGQLVTAGYLRMIPEDPFTNSRSTWETTAADYDPGNQVLQGIYDVRSGGEGQALDGSAYAEW